MLWPTTMQTTRTNPLEPLENRTLLAFAVGGAGLDYGTASARLGDGGTIVAGLFSGSVSFDPAGSTTSQLTSVGASDVFVARYDASEQLVWVRQFGGNEGRFEIEEDLGEAVDVPINPLRAGGEFYVGAVGPDPIDAGEYVNALAIAPDGSIYLTGGFRGRVDFDPGPATRRLDSDDFEFYDAFVVKLTSDGNLVWAHDFGGRFTDVGNDIALDPAGNPYVTGLFTRDADFQPGSSTFNLTARGRADAFAMKLSVNGKLIWASAVGGEEIDRFLIDSGNGIAVDRVGNVFVTGTFAGRADFNPTPARGADFFVEALDETDGFVMQLSARGKLVWVRTFGGFAFDGGSSVSLIGDPFNPGVVVAGYFEEDIDVTVEGTTTRLRAAPVVRGREPEDTDLLVSRYDGDGNLRWAKELGGGGYETVGRVVADAAENVFLAGGFWGTADFDPGRARFDLRSARSPFEIDDPNEEDEGERRDSYDAYFASLDGGGRFRFAQRFGGEQDDFAIGLNTPAAGASTGTYALVGRLAGAPASLDPAGTVLRNTRGRGDVFVSIFNSDGELI
jgi:hypothetical protein